MQVVTGAFRPFLFALLLTCVHFAPVKAQEVEISGLLLDNTISRQGRDFSFYFAQLWRDVPDTSGLNVHIAEVLIPQSGTRLSVKLNSQPVFVIHLGRRQNSVKELAEQAIITVIQAVASQNVSKQNKDIAQSGW